MSMKSSISFLVAFSFISISLFALTATAKAAVIINEVMYNPQGTDAGREWVELYNDGSSDVTIVGGSGKGSWRVVDSSNNTIVDPAGGVGRGSLVVPAGGYLVVASDPSLFMGEYSGSYSVAKSSLSLNNNGTTVSLLDGNGATVDSLAYVPGQGGNDNGASLQRAGAELIQALPTPGATNAAVAYVPPAQEEEKEESSSSKTSNPGYVAAPVPQVFADAGGDRTVIVGADSKFVATAYDRSRDVINYAKFYWNFGDGTTAEGPWVMHHFSYPGRYAVELMVVNTKIKTTSRITVTAEPASVAVEPLPLGGVSIKNSAGRDLDLSYWVVKEGENTFTLAEHSVVLKGASLNIAAKTLGFEAHDPKLLYPDGTEVRGSDAADTAKEDTEHASAPEQGEELVYAPLVSMWADGPTEPQATSSEVVAQEMPAAVAASESSVPWLPIVGLGGLVGVGIASTWAVRKKPATSGAEGEFEIEE